MIKEIETKAKISSQNGMFTKLTALLTEVKGPIFQLDRYFCNFSEDFAVFRPHENFLRIRKTEGAVLFTLKQPQSNELDVIEKTIIINDEQILSDMIALLGYREIISVNKKRLMGTILGWSVCLDDVEELGYFIELKYVGEESAEDIQIQQKSFLISLGIKEEDIVISGYDTMLYVKKYKK